MRIAANSRNSLWHALNGYYIDPPVHRIDSYTPAETGGPTTSRDNEVGALAPNEKMTSREQYPRALWKRGHSGVWGRQGEESLFHVGEG